MLVSPKHSPRFRRYLGSEIMDRSWNANEFLINPERERGRERERERGRERERERGRERESSRVGQAELIIRDGRGV